MAKETFEAGLARLVTSAQDTLLDRIDSLAAEHDLDDEDVKKRLKDWSIDLPDAWVEYITDENYERGL